MDKEPSSWKEMVNAPEIPFDFKGEIVQTIEYFRKADEPKVSFVSVLYLTKMENEDCKWYISNATASFLERSGYRAGCIIPRSSEISCFVWNFEDTKKYAEWFFAQKGKFISKIGSEFQYHFLLMFFCKDEAWKPFHCDFIYQKPSTVTLATIPDDRLSSITEKLLGSGDFQTRSSLWKHEEIEFMRILIALIALRPKFRNKASYSNFVPTLIREYNNLTGYKVEDRFEDEYESFRDLSYLESPVLMPLIYRYFFSLHNRQGDFVRKSLENYYISLFILIYKFLTSMKKTLVHFDEVILKEASLYINKIKELEVQLGKRLPYAELLTLNFAARADNWKNLAAVALLYNFKNTYFCRTVVLSSELENKLIYELNKLIPNLEDKMEPTECNEQNKIYKQFEEMSEVHEAMKYIPIISHETDYCNILCKQFMHDYFY